MGIQFGKHIRRLLDGTIIEILGRSEITGRLNIRKVQQNLTENIPELDLVEEIARGEAMTIPDPANDKEEKYYSFDLNDLDPKVKARMDERWSYVQEWLLYGVGKPSARQLRPIINRVYERHRYKHKRSVKSVRRWIRRAQLSENPTAHSCIPRDHDKGNREPRQAGVIEHVLDEVLNEHYYKQENKRRKTVYTFFVDAIRTKWPKLKEPSLRSFYRMVEKLDKRKRIASQEDLIEADKATKPRMAGPKAEFPLHVVEIDHSQLNIDLLDIENGVVLRRPWITLVIDRFSKMILGFYIGFEKPSSYTVLQALKHAIYPKTYVKAQHPNIVKDWPCYGAPRYLVCDNGKDLHSNDTREALARLNTIVCYCEKLRPWFKGLIESTFKTLSELMRELPGKTDSNYIKKGRYKSEVFATFTMPHLINYIHQYVVDIYQFSPHSGLKGLPPRIVWDEAIKTTEIRAPYNLGDMKTALLKTEYRSIKKRCIEIFSMIYGSENPEFAALLRRENIPDQVKVKYDEANIGTIWIVDWLDENHSIPLKCISMPDYADGLPLAVHNILLAMARRDADKFKKMFEEHLRQTRVRMHQYVKQLEAQGDLTHHRLREVSEYLKKTVEKGDIVMTMATIITPSGEVHMEIPVDATLVAANSNQNPQEPLPPRQDELSEDEEEAAIYAHKAKYNAN